METDIALVPGNGGCDVFSDDMWYNWVKNKLNAYDPKLNVRAENMPDPIVGRESLWIPFMREELKIGENSIIVGHSTGAVAAVRFCEQYKVRGIVIVGAYTTDCGIENERLSGYFDRPWEWDKVKTNTDWIVQFGSEDDEYLSWAEQVEVSVGLKSEFHQFKDRGHFISGVFPEMIKVLKQKLES